MKRYLLTTILVFFSLASSSEADEFLGLPLLSGAYNIIRIDNRLEMTTDLTHDQVLSFYKVALKDQADVKYRNWKDSTYIEDDGISAWHSITISKEVSDGTFIVIAKDSWSWIIGTLTLRFIGVFIVLCILYLGMSVSGKIISRSISGHHVKQLVK